MTCTEGISPAGAVLGTGLLRTLAHSGIRTPPRAGEVRVDGMVVLAMLVTAAVVGIVIGPPARATGNALPPAVGKSDPRLLSKTDPGDLAGFRGTGSCISFRGFST
jgi:hypothetical protein